MSNNSERPVDALAENGKLLTHSLTDNFKSRDASASKNGSKFSRLLTVRADGTDLTVVFL